MFKSYLNQIIKFNGCLRIINDFAAMLIIKVINAEAEFTFTTIDVE